MYFFFNFVAKPTAFEAQFNNSENLRKFGTKTLGTKTLPLVTMHKALYLKVIPMSIDFFSRGFT